MDWIEQVSAFIFLFILPGWALLSLLGRNIRLEFGEKVGLSAGLSVSLYPVLFLFFSLFNIYVPHTLILDMPMKLSLKLMASVCSDRMDGEREFLIVMDAECLEGLTYLQRKVSF